MTSKSAPIPFQPAPRPHPRISPEQTRELAEATRDLGFGRTTSTPQEQQGEPHPLQTASDVATAPLTEDAAASSRSTPDAPQGSAPTPQRPAASAKMASLKVAMPDEIWNALRLEALHRRVTVKYLVMEALAAKGYDIDLSEVAEDGRRLR